LKQYFRISNPSVTCAGPKAGVGYVLNEMKVLDRRRERGLTGRDFSVEIHNFGMWVLNEIEIEFISRKEYFVESLHNTFDRFRNYK